MKSVVELKWPIDELDLRRISQAIQSKQQKGNLKNMKCTIKPRPI